MRLRGPLLNVRRGASNTKVGIPTEQQHARQPAVAKRKNAGKARHTIFNALRR